VKDVVQRFKQLAIIVSETWTFEQLVAPFHEVLVGQTVIQINVLQGRTEPTCRTAQLLDVGVGNLLRWFEFHCSSFGDKALGNAGVRLVGIG
jgi:hypothetical protein